MITNLAHVCLFSKDLNCTLGFYVDVLGLKKKFDFIKDGKLFGFYLEISPTQFIEVFLRQEGPQQPFPAIGHLCLEVKDIEQVRKKLLQHGFEATEAKLGADESWQTWTKDPDGTPIEFHQYTEKSHQHSGLSCQVNW